MKLKMVGIFLCGSLRGVARFLVSYVIVGSDAIPQLGPSSSLCSASTWAFVKSSRYCFYLCSGHHPCMATQNSDTELLVASAFQSPCAGY